MFLVLVKAISNFISTNDMVKINVLVLIILSFYAFGCMHNSKELNAKERTFELVNIDTTQNLIVVDEDGVFLEFSHIANSKYLARWSNDKITFSKDTLIILPEGNPQITILRNKGVYVQQGCGSSCFFGYVLSFSNKEAKYYLYPLLASLEQGLIAYNGENTENLVIVENFNTNKKKEIKADFLPGIYPGHSIESINFTGNNEITITWLGTNEEVKNQTFKLFDLE